MGRMASPPVGSSASSGEPTAAGFASGSERPPARPVDHNADLAAELRVLCRGEGLASPGLARRMGPTLVRVCGISPADSGHEVRAKVSSNVLAAARSLPDHARLCVLAALGLERECQFRFLQDRLGWLATRLDRAPRTVQRRVDDATAQLASALLRDRRPSDRPTGDGAVDGWYVQRLHAVLTLTDDSATMLETRRIVAVVDGLTDLNLVWAAPRLPEPGDEIDLLTLAPIYGGRLARDPVRSTPGLWAGRLQLPQALAAGDIHEFCVRVSTAQQLRPYLVVSTQRRHDEVEFRVKFETSALPEAIWTVDREPERMVEENVHTGRPLCCDNLQKMATTFAILRLGWVYGIRWAPDLLTAVRQ